MSNLFELNPSKLKTMSYEQLNELAKQIRNFLIESIIKTGGHLSSNLGVVELSIALHYVFDSPKDQLIFDIGHQSYTHKIITGRAQYFDKLRSKDGISGFTSYQESKHDVWEAGHAGTALSALMGVLYSYKIDQRNNHAIAIVGDGGLSSGMSLEALNLIGYHKLPGIIIINNNKMSISKSVGTIADLLNRDFEHKKSFFNKLGYEFFEVEDGHNIENLITQLQLVKSIKSPVIVLIHTIKGKGHYLSEEDTIGNYHMISNESNKVLSWSEAVSRLIIDIQEEIPTMVVVPAMEVGSHLTNFKIKYPERFLDVGISEEHAATMSAALAKNNQKVILSLYSTFSQRAYDQILNDIARPNLGVLITVDRAGLIAGDGDTHQGIYDVSMFNSMPNVIISAPRNIQDASDLLRLGLAINKPFVMRFPKGEIVEEFNYISCDISFNWEQINYGKNLNVISYGNNLNQVIMLNQKYSLGLNIFNAKFIKPLDKAFLDEIFGNKLPILVIEEAVNIGGLYSEILRYKEKKGYTSKVVDHNLNDIIITHGRDHEIRKETNFDEIGLLTIIKNEIR